MSEIEKKLTQLDQKFREASVDSLENKRAHTRISLEIAIQFRLKNYTTWQSASLINLSKGGAFISIRPYVKENDEIQLKIKLPRVRTPALLIGRVRWVSKKTKELEEGERVECGVEFVGAKKPKQMTSLTYFLADRICALALRHNHSFVARHAHSLSELKTAFNILYEEYLNRGYCDSNKARMHFSQHVFSKESQTFVLFRKNDPKQIIGTISLIVDSPCKLPLESLFSEDIAHIREQRRRLSDLMKGNSQKIAEVGLLALSSKEFKHSKFLLTDLSKYLASFKLFKAMFDSARQKEITDLFIAMHPKHEELYQYLKFRAIGKVKSYEGACGNLALPMHMHLEEAVKTPSDHGVGSYFLKEATDFVKPEALYQPRSQEVVELLKFQGVWNKLSEDEKLYFKQLD